MTATPFGEQLALAAMLDGAWVSLHTASPTSGNEITGGSYSRRPLNTYIFSSSEPTVASNDTIVEYAVASADYAAGANITHFALWDAETVGNMRLIGTINIPKPVLTGDIARFDAGALLMSCN